MRFEPKKSHTSHWKKAERKGGTPGREGERRAGSADRKQSALHYGVAPADVSESITPLSAQHPRLCIAAAATATTINTRRDEDRWRLSEVNKTKHLSHAHLLYYPPWIGLVGREIHAGVAALVRGETRLFSSGKTGVPVIFNTITRKFSLETRRSSPVATSP